MSSQPEGSHVRWPPGYDEANEAGTEFAENIHRMKGKRRGDSARWTVRFPNDKFVADEAVTLEEMRKLGAV